MSSPHKGISHRYVFFSRWGLRLTLIGMLLVISAVSVKAAVTLLYFSAISENLQVRLVWETATEFNNAGFFVQRSNQLEGGYERINTEIIQTKGSDFTGATYEYLDTGLANNTQYWYRLESIDLGQHSQYSDPVRAIVGVPATPSITPTSTVTRTPTATSEGFVASQTPTPTATRTSNPGSGIPPTSTTSATETTRPTIMATQPYPGPGGSGGSTTPSVGGESSLTPQTTVDVSLQTATATLIPFPTITIIFPDSTSAAPIPLPTLSNSSVESSSVSSLFRFWPFGLLIAAWLVLVAWFYLSHRHHH
jgi:hypothetical protein